MEHNILTLLDLKKHQIQLILKTLNKTIMRKHLSALFFLLSMSLVYAQSARVTVQKDETGMRLKVDGKDFMVNGMNWDYIPIGFNTVDANFWKKSDDVIKAGLDTEMSLLKNMGCQCDSSVYRGSGAMDQVHLRELWYLHHA
jgi:hypothetical protein